MDKEVKKVFTPKPMISFHSARKLSDYLLRPKMYPVDRSVGSKNYKSKRCEVSKNVKEASTLISTLIACNNIFLITSIPLDMFGY